MNKWTVNIQGKEYFTLSLVGEKSTLYTFGKLPKQGLLAKIMDFVKKNREQFLTRKSGFKTGIDNVDVRFKKIR